ncbi:hypothetical protein Q9251_02945 [Alkalihalobacillus macyae]|uniref:hypothetical protein n=1 Tax=Guptibacillus hwajinpoensis TaxID=208199 RepID=UPI00273C947A|nr:hypothetical protein [Alkalihalobacillus macyae]MDP4549832.1 hypothetical protein [Alkalihalobacillus macyae]
MSIGLIPVLIGVIAVLLFAMNQMRIHINDLKFKISLLVSLVYEEEENTDRSDYE